MLTSKVSNMSASEPGPSLSNIRNLGYNILKNLDDELVRDKEISELEPCSECTNDILTLPLKAFTTLSCGHIFHRSCIEKQLLFTKPGACPFPDCSKTVDIVVNPNFIMIALTIHAKSVLPAQPKIRNCFQ
jgi:hypothetical protein